MRHHFWIGTVTLLVGLGCSTESTDDTTPPGDAARAGVAAVGGQKFRQGGGQVDAQNRADGGQSTVQAPDYAGAGRQEMGGGAAVVPNGGTGAHTGQRTEAADHGGDQAFEDARSDGGGSPALGGSGTANDMAGSSATDPSSGGPGVLGGYASAGAIADDLGSGGQAMTLSTMGGRRGGESSENMPLTAGANDPTLPVSMGDEDNAGQPNDGVVVPAGESGDGGVIAAGEPDDAGSVAAGVSAAAGSPRQDEPMMAGQQAVRGGAMTETSGGSARSHAGSPTPMDDLTAGKMDLPGAMTAGEMAAGDDDIDGGMGGAQAMGGADSNGGGADAAQPPPECVALVEATLTFLDLLTPDKRDAARAPFGDNAHQVFEFLPPLMIPRTGLSMRALNRVETDALATVLRAALSETGYQQVETIRNLESVLARMDSGQAVTDNRDPNNYFFQVFGEPRIDGDTPWGFRFEGHHLSIQMATLGCTLFSATPNFWGASPRTEVLAPIIDAANALLNTLTAAQQRIASVNFDLIALTQKMGRVPVQATLGLQAGDMGEETQNQLRTLLGAYLNTMAAPIAADRFAAINAAGFTEIGFAHRDGDFRVIGPTFLIEFVYHQGDRNHIHTAWRDFEGDYGADLIGRHVAMDADGHGEMGQPDAGGTRDSDAEEQCRDDCQDGQGVCCGGCLANNGVCYAESRQWCDQFVQHRWCGR
ncbi:MAG: DUF3500 domain-containing protein [Myxococcota bacterium]|nr:DUF3500 domain-containing protein [Myxococcota bacterium]